MLTAPRIPFWKIKRVLFFCFLLVLGYSWHTVGRSEVGSATTSVLSAIPLGDLQTNSKRIMILLTEKGPVFTIKDSAGNSLAVQLTEEELLAGFPDLAQIVATGLAGNDATLVVFD